MHCDTVFWFWLREVNYPAALAWPIVSPEEDGDRGYDIPSLILSPSHFPSHHVPYPEKMKTLEQK